MVRPTGRKPLLILPVSIAPVLEKAPEVRKLTLHDFWDHGTSFYTVILLYEDSLATSLANLRELNLEHCRFTETGMDNLLRHCPRITSFRYSMDGFAKTRRNWILPIAVYRARVVLGHETEKSDPYDPYSSHAEVSPAQLIPRLLRHTPDLQPLSIEAWGGFFAPGLAMRAASFAGFNKLERLSVDGCAVLGCYSTLRCVLEREPPSPVDVADPGHFFTDFLPPSIRSVELIANTLGDNDFLAGRPWKDDLLALREKQDKGHFAHLEEVVLTSE